jgi:hypothetical protein
MSATVCPVGICLRRVTTQTVYPALANGSSRRRNMRSPMLLGTAELPGPPWMNSSVFGPLPQVTYSIPFPNVPLRGFWLIAGAVVMEAPPVHQWPGASLPGGNLNVTAAAAAG